MKNDRNKVISEYDLGFENSIAYENLLSKFVMSWFGFNKFNKLCATFAAEDYNQFPQKLISRLNIEPQFFRRGEKTAAAEMFSDLTNGAIVVVNQPHGLLDLMVVLSLFKDCPRAKVLANHELTQLPQISGAFVPQKLTSGAAAAREAVDHLKNDGILVVFPARKIAHWRKPFGKVREDSWNHEFIRLAKLTQKPIVPLFISGSNSVVFQLNELYSPRFANFRALNELFAMRNKHIKVVVGEPISTLQPQFSIADLSMVTRKALFMLRETLLEDHQLDRQPNRILLKGSERVRIEGRLCKISFDEIKNDPTAVAVTPHLFITTPKIYNPRTTRRVTLFVDRVAVFDALMVRVTDGHSDRMESKYELYKDFDLLSKRVSGLVSQGAEFSSIYSQEGYEHEIADALRKVLQNQKLEYLWTTTHLVYAHRGLLLSETLRYLGSTTTAKSKIRQFSRGILSRSGLFPWRRYIENSTLNLLQLDNLISFGEMVGESLTRDRSSVIEIDAFTRALYLSGAQALKIAKTTADHQQTAVGLTQSLSVLTVMSLNG